MAEISDLLEYGAQVRPPGLDELERVAARRRRRAAAMVVSVTAALVTVVATTGLLEPRDQQTAPVAPNPTLSRSADPAPTSPTPPPPDRTKGPFPQLTAEQIRDHPDAEVFEGDSPVNAAHDVGARTWSVCLAECTRATMHQEGELQEAVEVSGDGFRTGAVYRLAPGSLGVSHVIDDWFTLATASGATMVNARGETRSLTRGEPVEVTKIAGPLVYANGVAYVDLATLQLHAVEAPGGSLWDWGGRRTAGTGAASTWWPNQAKSPVTPPCGAIPTARSGSKCSR